MLPSVFNNFSKVYRLCVCLLYDKNQVGHNTKLLHNVQQTIEQRRSNNKHDESHIIRTVACEYNACDVQYRQIQLNISTGDISSVKSAMIIKRFRNLAFNAVTGARWAIKASTWPPTRRHLNSLWTTPSFTGKPFGGSIDPRPYGSLK